jgi:hypothetical protein
MNVNLGRCLKPIILQIINLQVLSSAFQEKPIKDLTWYQAKWLKIMLTKNQTLEMFAFATLCLLMELPKFLSSKLCCFFFQSFYRAGSVIYEIWIEIWYGFFVIDLHEWDFVQAKSK